MPHRIAIAAAAVVACATALAPVPAAAQSSPDWLLPRTRHFTAPIADPMEPRFAIGLIATDLLKSRGPERPAFVIEDSADAAFDVQATAAVGGTLPLFRLARWSNGGIVVGGQVGAFARFRIENPSRDDLGADWFVSMPIELAAGPWSGRVEIGHRSSHLGDEFLLYTGAERIEFGSEFVDGLAAWSLYDIVRVYGGGTWIFRSNTAWEMRQRGLGEHDRFQLQAGADGEWLLGGVARAYGGVDVQAAERSDWRTQIAAVAGVGVSANGRAIRLLARFHDGVSSLGEFFLTDERSFAIELEILP